MLAAPSAYMEDMNVAFSDSVATYVAKEFTEYVQLAQSFLFYSIRVVMDWNCRGVGVLASGILTYFVKHKKHCFTPVSVRPWYRSGREGPFLPKRGTAYYTGHHCKEIDYFQSTQLPDKLGFLAMDICRDLNTREYTKS